MTTTGLERELQEFWCDFEAAIGFRSTFSAMLAAHAGVAMGSGPPAGHDPYAERIDAISSGSRTYRALRRMQTSDVVVLFRLYGPRNARADYAQLGDLSPLAVLTDAAEDARCDVVLDESTRRSDTTGSRTKAAQERRRLELARDFWTEVGAIAKAADAFSRARGVGRQDELERRVDAGWTLLGQILDAYAVDGVVRARTGVIESTDREVTAESAVRYRLRATKDADGAAKQRAFIAEVTREAEAMRAAAMASYRAARAEERLSTKSAAKARQELAQVQQTAIRIDRVA